MKKNKGKVTMLTFRDNKGRTVKLPDSLTMEDLVKLGIKVRLRPIGAPLPDDWYAHPPDRTATLLRQQKGEK